MLHKLKAHIITNQYGAQSQDAQTANKQLAFLNSLVLLKKSAQIIFDLSSHLYQLD